MVVPEQVVPELTVEAFFQPAALDPSGSAFCILVIGRKHPNSSDFRSRAGESTAPQPGGIAMQAGVEVQSPIVDFVGRVPRRQRIGIDQND